jgi:signal transduction histidine kinase
MDPIAGFFQTNIVLVYFFYGLAFFCMGLIVWLESRRASELPIAQAIGPLAAFGILHGLHEWFEMFAQMSQAGATQIPAWLLWEPVRIAHLVISFGLLLVFAVRLIYVTRRHDGSERRFAYLAAAALILVWALSVAAARAIYRPTPAELGAAADVLARYILAIPASLLAAWAIILEQRSFKKHGMAGFGRDLRWAAWALLLYGLIGQAFPSESFLFPSTFVNAGLFLRVFGVPIQFFRGVQAAIVAVFVIRALRAFDVESQQRLARAHEAQMAAQQQALETQRQAQIETEALNEQLKARELLLGQLLHQAVSAQEGERQRIARELHDGAGQILTGLGLGLAAAAESVHARPDVAAGQLAELKRLNAQALRELHDIIGDLRPALLDDLGLVAALQSQVREFESRTGVEASLEVTGRRQRLKPEVETVVFRIAQEALTNIAKHAEASSACVTLLFDDECLRLTIQDDGRGFDPALALQTNHQRREAWGLLGIQERASLVGATCEIDSAPGRGTTIFMCVPLAEGVIIHDQN